MTHWKQQNCWKCWKHTITEGDRLDTVAYFYYRNAAHIEGILKANPWLPFNNNLTPFVGREIYIPVEKNLSLKSTASQLHGLKKLIQSRKNES